MVAFGVSALSMLVLIGVLLVAHIALSACQNLQAAYGGMAAASTGSGAALVHVCFAHGDPDLRPLVVAVRSLLVASAAPERLAVHIITSPTAAYWVRQAMHFHLPGVRVQVHHNSDLQSSIQSLLGDNSHGVEPFDFAPFYIDEYFAASGVQADRVVYVGTDSVVQGDIAELAELDLHGKAVAAVPDCRQHFQDVINPDSIAQFGMAGQYDPSSCAVSVGLLVIDMDKWRGQGITAKVEEWLVRTSKVPGGASLWRAELPGSAFLLASGAAASKKSLRSEAYHELDSSWSCDGLGHQAMSATEALELKRHGLNDTGLEVLHVSWDEEGAGQPRITLCSASAKVLRFTGAAKPWLALEGSRFGLCSAPASTPKEFWSSAQALSIAGRNVTFVSCQELWSLYISPDILADEDEDDEEASGSSGPNVEEKWDKSHKKFVDNLRKQVVMEQSGDKEAEREMRLKKLLQKMKKKDEELQKRRVVGGFMVGQNVKSMADISVRGQIVVPRGTVGAIQGPSLKNPLVRINVFFKARLDGKFRSVNVLPREIVLADDE